MKTLRKQSLFVLAALAIATTCRAQTAEEIVAKSLQAVGGMDVINSVKSVVYTQSLEVMGQELPNTIYLLTGKGFKSETDYNGTKIIQCISDHGGWAINPMAGQATATAMPDDAVKQAQGRLNPVPLVGYAANGGKLELVGKDSADYKIHMTNTVGSDATYYINMKTYLIDKVDLKVNMGGQQGEATMHYSDYRKSDNGLVVAWMWVQDNPQMSLTFTTKKVEVNTTIDPSIFEMPK